MSNKAGLAIMLSALLLGTSVVPFQSVQASTRNVLPQDNTQTEAVTSIAKFQFAENIYYETDEYLNAKIIDASTGESTWLPAFAMDKNGSPVRLNYYDINDSLYVQAELLTFSRSLATCIAGTAGGAVTGAGTLGLGGAAVGTVTVPVIGTVSAGAVGAVVGFVGGGLTGFAASCG